jgi:hypothetical protein
MGLVVKNTRENEGVFGGTMRSGIRRRTCGRSLKGGRLSVLTRAPTQVARPVPEVALQHREAETEVRPESLNRALALLARWACRRRESLGKRPSAAGQNLVTTYGIKGYGARDAKE